MRILKHGCLEPPHLEAVLDDGQSPGATLRARSAGSTTHSVPVHTSTGYTTHRVPVHTSAGYTAQSVPSSGAHVSMTKCCKPLGDLVTLSVESSKWTVLISTRSREVAQWIAALCHTKYKVSVPSSKECNIVRRRGSPGTTAARGGRT